MRGIDIGIDTTDTRFESTWYRYRKHKSGIAHRYCLQWWRGKLCTLDFKIDRVHFGYYRNYTRIHFIYKVIAR